MTRAPQMKLGEPSKPIERNFADWESTAFGLGYGTGERPVLGALKKFFEAFEPDGRSYDYRKLEVAIGPEVTWLLINRLIQVDVIEYGTSPRHAWLTPEGRALKAFVEARSLDALVGICCSDADDICSPTSCNCGEGGYREGWLCYNPFWRGHHK